MTQKQLELDLTERPVVRDVLDKIRSESRDESEKGRWFELLFMRIALQEPEFEIDRIWRWRDWPEREKLTGLDGRDIGIDLVARRNSGKWVAIQCKCYDDKHTLRKGEIDKFLGGSQQKIFSLRWMVATCRWGPNAQNAIQNACPHITQIDFQKYLNIQVEEENFRRPVQEPWPLQLEAIEDVVDGLSNHDRGRLIMACGTGKTFTVLRIAEKVVNDGERILFAAPTIALVSQARREWLRQTTRPLKCIVVCSDPYAGGRNENEDIRISELECPVSTDPSEIACLLSGDGPVRVVFCTYHSLGRVTEAQAHYNAPKFELAIADEAHRTTGALLQDQKSNVIRKIDFQEFHDDKRLRAHKRLYMTATPRIYTERSKRTLAKQGIEVVDMEDYDVYGPELHRLPFAKAVEHRILSDYRVIVLGVGKASVTPRLRRRLEELDTSTNRKKPITTNDMTRVLGVSLAVNGITEGRTLEQPNKLSRTIAFANTIQRSKWYADALMESQILRATTRRMQTGRAMKVVARHLDASASALQRNQELRALADADKDGECRMVCNVKLFTEGVDVPQLDAVAFLDPRNSQVDVVQAVGRVMRKAQGKRFGYIIIPVVVEPGHDIMAALEKGTEGYSTVGRVLRALQAHDGRLAESPATFIKVYEQVTVPVLRDSSDGTVNESEGKRIQNELDLKEAEQGIYTHVVAASGLGKPGQLVADEIADAVKRASDILQEEKLEEPLADALDLVPEEDGGAKGICTVATLMLCNACLLQRRLRDEPEMKTIVSRLDKVMGASNPREILKTAWESILEKDYAPVFRPALSVLSALREGKSIDNATRVLTECANRVADSLSDLGYDHAGPLYHRILGSAKSDGAFYTNNLSAIMLARLAFTKDFIDWSDPNVVANLRIIDPACGTGTLLMAVLQTIKTRVAESKGMSDEDRNALHKRLVEDMLCGLDINRHGIQLAACNMTLGAPTVDYKRMNLATMPHGPQIDGQPPKAGSLEILIAADHTRQDLQTLIAPPRSLSPLDATQVNENSEIRFPLQNLDTVIMNAPFTANKNRNEKYGEIGKKAMQRHELRIQEYVERIDHLAKNVITSNSISTFFTPLADILLSTERGTLAKVIPTTACTNTSGLAERQFLANRFHIETVVTSHDPRRPNFSENTAIHETLLICRRKKGGGGSYQNQATRFVALHRMPSTSDEVIEVVEGIQSGKVGKWFTVYEQPEARIRKGDWRPCQFLDPELVNATLKIEKTKGLVPLKNRHLLGPSGRGVRGAFYPVNDDSNMRYHVFWGRSKDLRTTMEADPEQRVIDKKKKLANRYREQAGYVLLASKFNTLSGRLLAIFSNNPSVGSMWVPIQSQTTSLDEAKALCAWFNSTLGALGFFNSRGSTLMNPSFSQERLAMLRVPDFKNTSAVVLTEAYEHTKHMKVEPWKKAGDDDIRDQLDQAVAQTTGIDIEKIRDWRHRVSCEPTITNKRFTNNSE